MEVPMHPESVSLRRRFAGSFFAGVCLLLCISGSSWAGDDPEKQPVPAAAALAEAQQTVKEVFKEDLSKAKKPDERVALGKRVLQAGTDEQSSASRFALLSLARDIGAEVGDAQTAFAAADLLERGYTLDGHAAGRRLALSLSKTLRSAEQRKIYAQAVDSLVGQLIAADQYDQVKLLTDVALLNARALGDAAQLKQVAARVTQTRECETAYAEAKKAFSVLEKTPSDPEANAKLGRFKCLVKGDFEGGVPLLALGYDPILKPIAEIEVKGVTTAAEQVKLADGWWDLSEKLTGAAKTRVQQRAGRWYTVALNDLEKGLLREKVEKRLKMIPPVESIDAVVAKPASGKGPSALRLEDLDRYEKLDVSHPWDRTKPRTVLAAQTVSDSLILKSQNSPYLVTGLLVIEAHAKLLIEPGTVVLFAPGITLENKGAITMTSDGAWIVLASAEAGKRWKGIDCSGTIAAKRCLLEGAENAVEIHNRNNAGTFSACIFANCGCGLSVGNGGSATTDNSLYIRNETAVFGHGDFGKVTFTRCLILLNGRGCSGNFYGSIDGSNSTLYANTTGVEAADRGNFVRVRLSNIMGNTLTGTRGGKAQLAGNYWGKDGPGDGKGNDVSGPLPALVKDAMPNLPAADFLIYKQ
jgi:hypothetical protein